MKNSVCRRRFLRCSLGVLSAAMSGLAKPAALELGNGEALPRRPIAQVSINGRGPFRFAFDSAAGTSAISAGLMRSLGLAVTPERGVIVNSAQGRMQRFVVHIARLQCGTLLQQDAYLPLLDRYATPKDDGLLGVDALANKLVSIDVTKGEASVSDARSAPGFAGLHSVRLRRVRSGLSLLRLDAGGFPCTAILDTGAERSVGNTALRDTLTRAAPLTQDAASSVIADANGRTRRAAWVGAPTLKLGDIGLAAAPLLCDDLPIFAALELAQHPALLLGMDRLGDLQQIQFDYARDTLWIRVA